MDIWAYSALSIGTALSFLRIFGLFCFQYWCGFLVFEDIVAYLAECCRNFLVHEDIAANLHFLDLNSPLYIHFQARGFQPNAQIEKCKAKRSQHSHLYENERIERDCSLFLAMLLRVDVWMNFFAVLYSSWHIIRQAHLAF